MYERKSFFIENINKILSGIFSVILAVVLFLSKYYIYSGIIYGGVSDNYVKNISLISLATIPLIAIIIYYAILLLKLILIKLENKLVAQNKPISKRQKVAYSVIILIVLLLFWSPYYLTYFPGAVYSDGFSSIGQTLTGVYNNHHPVLYSFFVGLFTKIGLKVNNLDLGIYLYTLTQTIIMASVMVYFLVWLYRNNINKYYIGACGVFIAIFPLFPFYAVALWKDTFFSLSLFLYILYHIDIVTTKGEMLSTPKGIIKYCILTFLVVFLRNNGMYITIFTWLFLLFTYRNKLKRSLKSFLLSSIILFVIFNIIQGPIYKSLGFTTEFAESVGIPLQQISRVVVLDGEYNNEQKQLIEGVLNTEILKENYKPCIVDSIKFNPEVLNSVYLEEHKKEFIKVWVQLFFKNSKIYWDAFLLENIGYWNVNASGPEAYVQAGVWPNTIGMEQKDYFKKITGISLSEYVYPKHFISSATLFWSIMISMMVVILRKRYEMIISFLPIIALWLTLMIASPIAISLRYTYVMVLVIPLLFVWPVIKEKKEF